MSFHFSFTQLKDWLDKNADYEAIVDGANVGLYQQNFADGGFSVSQVVTLMLFSYFFIFNFFPLSDRNCQFVSKVGC